MPSQLVPSVRERATPGLNRGWRTPDPSPTRTSNGLPHCGVSSWKVMTMPEVPDETVFREFDTSSDGTDVRDSSPVHFGRAADTACADAAPIKQGGPASGLQLLKLNIDDHELVEASTPRGRANNPDSAWARIRTPSPEARTMFPYAPSAWPQGMPEGRPPQWTFWPLAAPPAAWAEATPGAAWARFRTSSPDPRPPQMPFWEPWAEPPPPPAPAAAAAPRGQACAKEAKATMVQKKRRKQPPLDSLGMPKDFTGVLSVGSVGHPYACQAPCKFVRKNRGCKDGADCSHCHVCTWNRYEASRAASMK